MIRVLLYQKLLTAVNACLLAALAGVVGLAVFGRGPASVQAEAPAADRGEENVEIEMPDGRVGQRSDYNAMVEQGLFGEAAKGVPEKPPEPKPVELKPAAEETRLPLRLLGTVVSGDADDLASAVIEVRKGGNNVETFFVGQAIMDGVILREVSDRSVLLENRSQNRMERLTIDSEN